MYYFLGNMPDARVVAIEPEAGNFDLLSRNVDGLAVETVNAAVSSAPGRARTVDPGRGHWGYRTTDAAEDVAMRCRM